MDITGSSEIKQHFIAFLGIALFCVYSTTYVIESVVQMSSSQDTASNLALMWLIYHGSLRSHLIHIVCFGVSTAHLSAWYFTLFTHSVFIFYQRAFFSPTYISVQLKEALSVITSVTSAGSLSSISSCWLHLWSATSWRLWKQTLDYLFYSSYLKNFIFDLHIKYNWYTFIKQWKIVSALKQIAS